ncbi:MAG: rhamnulokinase, partial [Williamsia herbipolensis]|nr:rhamnulokinase [Williamsia herbipolensis]
MTAGEIVAVDLGAASGRVMLASVGPDRLSLRQTARFPTGPMRLWQGDRTALVSDLPGIVAHAVEGLAVAGRAADHVHAIGVDSWAVDYGLLRDGRLLGLPHHYRDTRSESGVAAVHAVVPPEDLHVRNGLQFLPFTTVYQLAADRSAGVLDGAERALLIPDLVAYWLTGEMVTERTNASTTGLLGIDGRWDDDLCRRVGVPTGLFPDLVETGSEVGPILADVAEATGLDDGTRVVSVATHDTASAVVAVPMDPTRAAYISCGTWGLVGVELDGPVVSDAARTAGFTNEVGADGRIRFLHNVMGLWLLNESVEHFRRRGDVADLATVLDQAADLPTSDAVIDVDDPRFAAPGDVPVRIDHWLTERGLPVPGSPAATMRLIVDSLAVAFADAVRSAGDLSGVPVAAVHMVGGGAQNALLCQCVADRLGLPVLAGPVEATAIGNVLVAARSQGLVAGGLDALRDIVRRQCAVRRFVPRS